MGNPPLTLVGWMMVAMVTAGGGMIWGWPSWFIGVLCLGVISMAYMMTRKAWMYTRVDEERMWESLHQLQEVTQQQLRPPGFPPKPEALSSEFQDTVGHIKTRMANLEEERAKITAIVENLVEGVVAFDSRGQVLFSNPSACRILGLDTEQLQGRSVWEVLRNKELAELVERCLELPLDENQRTEIEIHGPASMTVEVYGLPFPLANQQRGSVIVLHDVTQLRRLEKVRAEFIDNVSHELRTPLTVIVGYLETLNDEPSLDTPNNRKFLHIAHQHAERLSRLVDDLRSLSEIESGNVILRCETVSLRDIVEEVCEMFQSQLSKKALQVSNDVDHAYQVWVDRDRVIQVLVNVVDNAIKYTSSGGMISFQALPQEDQRILLQVKDTGQGIPSTDLPRITERFYRVDRARSRAEGGTGLGLSIVKHLVQLLRGQLRIQSEFGKGTTIEIILPVSAPESSH